MIRNGLEPFLIVGGALDGLRYFPREIDGVVYLVSEIGLLDAPLTLSDGHLND